MNYQNYKPFAAAVPSLPDRQWPSKKIERAPVWCSVDLRDGNQALPDPMDLDEKLYMFKELCKVGFNEIEVGFPSASEADFDTIRALIERNLIPDDVTIQVLVQSREHLIRRTFDSIKGAKNVIFHFYSATSELHRRVAFHKTMAETIEMTVESAKIIKELAAGSDVPGLRFEYSPETFSGTEPSFACEICDAVLEALGAAPENKTIINLPSTVQLATPNVFADQVEYFCGNLKNRESAIISVHPHNDRGTGVADAELAMMAGADRVEGTLFGNGERTGNCDIVTLALNMLTHGIDPGLDFSDLPRLRRMYERCTKMHVPERYPYAGDLVFTAFSGSHQDAINKGFREIENQKDEETIWNVPYLVISPADIGRQYEPVIRINSQSGKGGAAFIMHQSYGFLLPKGMHPEFGQMVKRAADMSGKELSSGEVKGVFDREYLDLSRPYTLVSHTIADSGTAAGSVTKFTGRVHSSADNKEIPVFGSGNGPIDAFVTALGIAKIAEGYRLVSYNEHAIGEGQDAKAVAYIELRTPDNRNIYGVGIDENINLASIKAVLCAVNRSLL